MRKKSSNLPFRIIVAVTMAIAFAITLAPLLHVASMSISRPDAVMGQDVFLLPKGFSLSAYKLVLENPEVVTSYLNTIFYTVVGTLFSATITLLAAFALSRKDFFGGSIIMKIFLFTMYFSGGMIPGFLLIQNLGLYNTRLSMILPGAINVYTLIIATTFFRQYPEAVLEAATIDGSNHFGLFFRIVLPTSSAIIAVVALFYAVDKWNAYFNATLFLRDQNLQPLQVYLAKVLSQNSTDMLFNAGSSMGNADRSAVAMQMKYALIMVSTLPIMISYPFAQKYLIKGVMIGSVKG